VSLDVSLPARRNRADFSIKPQPMSSRPMIPSRLLSILIILHLLLF
jgi:hypothetical protein